MSTFSKQNARKHSTTIGVLTLVDFNLTEFSNFDFGATTNWLNTNTGATQWDTMWNGRIVAQRCWSGGEWLSSNGPITICDTESDTVVPLKSF